ncbi:hypothetical protein AGMMS50239_08230 [Bacteroidia bacterium]|nr:hypothetical protein AGMMS50239_08230 [Bacteroidia bacterium]
MKTIHIIIAKDRENKSVRTFFSKKFFLVKQFFFIIASLILASCGDKSNKQTEVIIVDVTETYPAKEMHLQDIADVKYVPLGSNEEFLIGDYFRIASVDDERIVIFSRNHIFTFDPAGNPLTLINKTGQKKGEEYNSIYKSIIEPHQKKILIFDLSQHKCLVFDLQGNYERDFPISTNNEYITINDLENFDENNLILYTENLFEINKTPFLILSKNDGKIMKQIEIPFEKIIIPAIVDAERGVAMSVNYKSIQLLKSGFLLTELSSDTIYHLSSSGQLSPFIARTPAIQSMNKPVFLLFGAETVRYLFMSTVVFKFDFESFTGFPETPLIYDKKEEQTYQCVLYNDDYPSKKQAGIENSTNFINTANATAVVLFQAYELIEAYKQGNLNGQLKEIASKLTEDDNPVLMVAKFKNDL